MLLALSNLPSSPHSTLSLYMLSARLLEVGLSFHLDALIDY